MNLPVAVRQSNHWESPILPFAFSLYTFLELYTRFSSGLFQRMMNLPSKGLLIKEIDSLTMATTIKPY